jgi:hypothetical protein
MAIVAVADRSGSRKPRAVAKVNTPFCVGEASTSHASTSGQEREFETKSGGPPEGL